MDQEDVHSLFGRHVSAMAYLGALRRLERDRLVRSETRQTGGRPRRVWTIC
jgi:DNA-binding PadR family transcriptional regulator